MTDFVRHPVLALRAGDVLHATGQTIISVSAGISTPRGKMDVVLEKNGQRRTATWNRSTMISIKNREGA